MSSKIVQPDDSSSVSPFPWRRVDADREEARRVAGDLQLEFQDRISQIEQQCEQRVRAARAAGVGEGEATGQGRAAAELQPVIERLARAVDEIAQMRARLRREAESDLISLSLAIARRVLRRELAIDPDALHGLVLGALEKLQGQEICRVKVHPSHVGPVTAALPPAAGSPIEVVPDASLLPGSVVFETARGDLDASVDSQLQEIERGLADRLRRSP